MFGIINFFGIVVLYISNFISYHLCLGIIYFWGLLFLHKREDRLNMVDGLTHQRKFLKSMSFINFSFSRLFSEIGIIVLSTTVSNISLKFNQEEMENVTGLHNTLTAVKSETKARNNFFFLFSLFFFNGVELFRKWGLNSFKSDFGDYS